MKIILVAALAAAGLAASAISASAMTFAPTSANGNSLVQTVAGGCGRGYHPNPWGRCVPNRDQYRRDYGNGYNQPRYRPAPGYGNQPRYRAAPGYGHVPREGCPRGKHPGNSGRCVPNY